MAKNTFAIYGIFALLLVSLTMVSAANENGVTLTIDVTSLNDVNVSDTYNFEANIENANGTNDYYVVFGTTNWTWSNDEANLTNGTNNNYTGILTISASKLDTKSVIAKFYETSNHSNLLFKLSENISITYYEEPAAEEPEEQTACEFDLVVDENGDLEITDFDMNNLGNGDEDVWKFMDSIEFEVEVENTDSNEDIRDVEVKAIIMTQDDDGNWTNDVTSDFDLEDDIITSIGKLRDGDSETVIFEIKEVPSDITEGDYRLYIMTYSDGEEDTECISKYNNNNDDFTDDLYYEFEVEGVDYEDSIVAKKYSLDDFVDTYCGENNVEITIPIYNLNDDDEEMVLVNIYNSELNINEFRTIEDLRDGRQEDVTFFVSIPDSLDKEKYDLKINVYFDWDSDEDEYSEFSYDESNEESLRFNIIGCAIAAPLIKPTLESETEEGKELVVKTLITNNGDNGDFKIFASGYESWATLVSVTPETATIAKGESVETIIVLMPNSAGMKSFKISTTIGDETFNQPVSVNIKESLNFFGLKGMTLYLVAGISGMLILILVVLIAKVASKKPVKANF